MGALFQTILVQPILNLLIWLYNVLPGNDIGLAIILLTIIVKLILWPLTLQQIKQQKALQELQPKIDEIRKRLKDDKDAQAKELLELYKKDKVNPAASCLPLLVQLPIFIGLYQALRDGLASKGLNLLYPFVANPGTINQLFLGVVDLSKPNYVLEILAGVVQYFQTSRMMKKPNALSAPPKEVEGSAGAEDESMATMMNKQMVYMMPLVTIFIGISLPGGLSLYWFVMSLLTFLQQELMMRKPSPPKVEAQLS